MDVAPVAVEVAVVTGAVVQGACMQLYAAAAAWVWQRAACVAGYAGVGGWGHGNGWQAASVHAAVGSGCGVQQSGVCAVKCSGSCTFVWQRVGRWRCKWQQLTAVSC
jgi:hypothetical protein